jgi:[acyl-carrier-protein] S-malonyltransferase
MQPPPTALLFPGQGSQCVGMGRRLAADHAVARATFEEADDALGQPLTRLCFEGPDAELIRTENAQPAILAISIATWRALASEVEIAPSWLAGHSLGEYSALVVAGALPFADALRLVHARGRLMQQAVPQGRGAMAAIFGLAAEAVEQACAEAADGEVVAPANLNGAGQIVIAGEGTAVRRAIEIATRAGGRAIELAVSAPFHCALMAPAAEGLARALAAVRLDTMRLPVVTNVEATLNQDADRVAALLVRQVTAPVRWEASMQLLQRLGCARAIEIGPGQVLTKLLQRMRLGIDAATAGEGPAAEWRQRLEPARALA